MPRLNWLRRPIAHRGLHDKRTRIVENTPSAFSAAIEAGYAIECDVQRSADGVPMVFHDDTLERLTEHSGKVVRYSQRQLKQMSFKDTRDRMLTLGELLELVNGAVPLVIEIKSDWMDRGPFEARICSELAAYKGHAAVMSFDPHAVRACAEHGPRIPRGLVAEDFRDDAYWGELSEWQRFRLRHLLSAFVARPQFIAYDIRALPAFAPVAARALLGWPLLTWTVRSKAERERAEKWTDAIIFERLRP